MPQRHPADPPGPGRDDGRQRDLRGGPHPDHDGYWRVLLAAAALARQPEAMPETATGFALAADGELRPADAARSALLFWQPLVGWRCADTMDSAVRAFVELYLPLCQPLFETVRQQPRDLGRRSTRVSARVTGPDNIVHLHRMRALSDAVIVGAGTVAADDPRLTTRLVAGAHATRVVLDPDARLGIDYQLFRDGEAPTLLCRMAGRSDATPARAEAMEMPVCDDRPDLGKLVAALAERGLRRLFVEGGGVTVSDFLQQGLLDRLQIAVAPLIIGRGRAGVTAPPCGAMDQALRPPMRLYQMGEDVLYDFDLGPLAAPQSVPAGIQRLA
jgi:diaminohydroxyphosphoribosylaminopyrimidine deaminase/5-amino-6-(5-phosphoribosylamino)uracil reductase